MADKWIQLQSADGTDNLFPVGKMDLLWTNSNPTATFAGQTIPLDLSKYILLYIVCRRTTGSDTLHINGIIKKGESGQVIGNYNGWAYREISSSNDAGIKFGSGVKGTSSFTTDNTYAIPLYIYGICGKED